MTASGWTWLAAAGVLAVIDWVAVGERARRLERIAKPLVLLALIAAVLTTRTSDVRSWLLAALAFGLIGDIALAFERRPELVTVGADAAPVPRLAAEPQSPAAGGPMFLVGLAAFLVGHLCYIGAMTAHGIDRLSVIFGLVLVLIALLSFGYRIIAGAHSAGGIPLIVGVTLYLVALGSTVVFGVGTTQLWVAAGVVLFAISDLTLGYDRFVLARPWAPVAVMVTYHLAQASIVLGLVG